MLLNKLISVVKQTQLPTHVPLSVYSSIKEQKILNVPIVKPVLIIVLSGTKQLGENSRVICEAGDFVMLFDSPSLSMRNIPNHEEYLALLIEFEYEELNAIQSKQSRQTSLSAQKSYCHGKSTQVFIECLTQLIESVSWAPVELIASRKKEIIELLLTMGYVDVLSLRNAINTHHKVHELYNNAPAFELSVEAICSQLGMSESTLHRKLKAEDTSLQQIKDQARLGLGLHLLQTTQHSVGFIAERCGYQSQSKFSTRFKARFGLTPSALKQTKTK